MLACVESNNNARKTGFVVHSGTIIILSFLWTYFFLLLKILLTVCSVFEGVRFH